MRGVVSLTQKSTNQIESFKFKKKTTAFSIIYYLFFFLKLEICVLYLVKRNNKQKITCGPELSLKFSDFLEDLNSSFL